MTVKHGSIPQTSVQTVELDRVATELGKLFVSRVMTGPALFRIPWARTGFVTLLMVNHDPVAAGMVEVRMSDDPMDPRVFQFWLPAAVPGMGPNTKIVCINVDTRAINILVPPNFEVIATNGRIE